MKKVIALILAIIILISLVACGSTGDKPKPIENEKQQNQEQNVEKVKMTTPWRLPQKPLR